MDVSHGRMQKQTACLVAKAVVDSAADGEIALLECARECENASKFVSIHDGRGMRIPDTSQPEEYDDTIE
jgi:hypothetical protein